MIISCESCQARFRLADEKLKPGGTRVRCSKCQHVFTVMPPEPAPAEETVDFGDFNMERVSDDETPAAQPGMAPSAVGDDAETRGGAREFDFSAVAPPAEPDSPPPAAAGATADLDIADQPEPPEQTAPATEAVFGEFRFDEESVESSEDRRGGAVFFAEAPATDGQTGTAADSAIFDFDSTAPSDAEDFPAVPSASTLGELPFAADGDAGPFAFEEPAESATGTESFGFEEEGDSPLFKDGPAFGDEDATAWGDSAESKALSFDFDTPSFADEGKSPLAGSGGREELSFGEIDLGQPAQRPESLPVTPPRPAAAEAAPPSPPPPQRTPPRPPMAAPLPAAPIARKSTSRMFLLLILLLLLLGGAGAYLYLQGDGQQFVERLLVTLTGEEPAAPVEQRIGLTISGSSYVDNREVGQMLVIQGAATNNFSGVRSAITVKGVLVDADGKVLQQQTVFCGNYLSEEKLRTMKYAQIEEAMNNQFGDSLVNMNVKSGTAIRFTVVFRNLPQNLANISVEVVDSKPGGL